MQNLRLVSALAAIMLLSNWVAMEVQAQVRSPFRLPLPFQKRDTDPSGDLKLKDDHGPWLIMCASFISEGRNEAESLCAELRSLGLEAYLYEKKFDYSGSVKGLGYQRENEESYDLVPKRMRAVHPEVVEDISVLVGHFPGPEDSRGLKTLEQIKHLFPESLKVSQDVRSLQRMATWRELMKIATNKRELKEMGPMRAAFMVPNPLLPEGYFDRPKVDPMVEKMNKGDKYSLLNNPRAYSVKIATFNGDSTFDNSEIQEKQKEFNFLKRTGRGLTESKLMEAESNANYLTLQLRKQGIEAYSYHDRYSSMVCVGSFDWAVRGEGAAKLVNPEIQAVIDRFQAQKVDNIPGVAPYYKTKTLEGPTGKPIALDLIPVAVSVPQAQ